MASSTTVLIVDDESHVRAYVRTLLKELGIETCWEATNGDAVLAMVKEHSPGLVLLDLNLPGTGGMQVLSQLAEAHPDVPVVIMTAQNSMDTVKEAAELGASGYILKHDARHRVVSALRDLIESLEASDDAAE
jgi:DNA-binding NarL/FixJ family response regulator